MSTMKFILYLPYYIPMKFTLFPDKVLPVMSSRFMKTENPSARPGSAHLWIGVLGCAS